MTSNLMLSSRVLPSWNYFIVESESVKDISTGVPPEILITILLPDSAAEIVKSFLSYS